MTSTEVTLETARKVAEVVGKGLCAGMGKPEPGKMCVEAAVCYAMGLPHSDEPPCVSDAVRAAKIQLNDSKWSSDRARGAGMLAVAVGQLGSKGVVDDLKFSEMFLWRVVREIVCPMFEKIGLPEYAEAMRSADTLGSLERSAYAAEAAAAAEAADGVGEAANVVYAASVTANVVSYAAAEAADGVGEDGAFYAVNAGAYAADDETLTQTTGILMDCLRECGSPGVALWDQLVAEGAVTV
jgi:hypothetical protein